MIATGSSSSAAFALARATPHAPLVLVPRTSLSFTRPARAPALSACYEETALAQEIGVSELVWSVQGKKISSAFKAAGQERERERERGLLLAPGTRSGKFLLPSHSLFDASQEGLCINHLCWPPTTGLHEPACVHMPTAINNSRGESACVTRPSRLKCESRLKSSICSRHFIPLGPCV